MASPYFGYSLILGALSAFIVRAKKPEIYEQIFGINENTTDMER